MAKKAFSNIGTIYRVTLKNGEIFIGRLLDKIPMGVDDTQPLSIESLEKAERLLKASRSNESQQQQAALRNLAIQNIYKRPSVFDGSFGSFKFGTLSGVKEHPLTEIKNLEGLKGGQ